MTNASPPRRREPAEDIAIIGMACLFPGADTPARFWQNIVGKVDAVGDAPPDWQPEFFCDPQGPAVDRSYTRRGGFLGSLCRFDPRKYGVPPKDVDGAEPDQFIALRCASEALADAGVPRVPINREKTGVILGRGIFVNRGWVTVFQRTLAVEQLIAVLKQLEPHRSEEDFTAIGRELKRRLPPANADTFPGLVHSALVGRIANRMDLQGPAYTIDAACASTLVAVEQGMRELRSGRCDAMLVGGTQVSMPAPVHIMFCHLQALSQKGVIAPFSAEAEGTVLGQGCGIVVLKRRGDAERDGNRIYALLKSAGVSSDGRGAGLLAPRTEGQQLSIVRAYQDFDISPETVKLVEAHGTGIPLGDGVEVDSLKQCFGPRRGEHPDVALGSVKSMIGHLVPASGSASLIKTALALHHRVLPPTLHAETPHPSLELDETRFYLCNEARPWIQGDPAVPRRAGVNAFGFGGINAHLVLEEYAGAERDREDLEREWPCELVVISADDREALAQRMRGLSRWLGAARGCTLLDVAASCARLPGDCRLAIVARDVPDLVSRLDRAAPLLADGDRRRIQDRSGVYWYSEPLARQGRTALVFPGEGSQYPNMLGELCRHFPEVRREFDLTSRAYESRGISLARVLFPQPATSAQAERELFTMDTAVASVTAAARGLWRLLRVLEIEADSVVGHSSGEYAALLAAGAYRHDDDDAMVHAVLAGIDSAVQLRTANVLPPAALVSVGGVPDDVLAAVLAERSGDIEVAIDNCPHQRILVGSEASTSQLLGRLQGQGGLCQRLAWDRPYHTEAFAPACPIVQRYFDSLELCAPKIELWSCATAAPMPSEAEDVRELAVRQWRNKVRFRETIDAMYSAGTRVFIECGPRGNLSAFVADTLGSRPHAAVPLDVANQGGIQQLCRALGQLAAQGVSMRLDELYRRRRPRLLDFDAEPFQAAPTEPELPLELPLLELGDDVARAWRDGNTTAWQTTANPETASPAAAHNGSPSVGNGHTPVDTWVTTSHRTTAATVPVDCPSKPATAAQWAHREFQATMQEFLRTQVAIAELRGGFPAAAAAPQVFGDDDPTGAVVGDSRSAAARAVPCAPARRGSAAPASIAEMAAGSDELHCPPAGLLPGASSCPLVETILEHRPGERLVFECELNLDRHPALRDHTFPGGRVSLQDPQLTPLPVMPLALSLELLAEGAIRLCPQEQVQALASIRVSRWLPFAGQSRRVRVIATRLASSVVDARMVEADGDSEHEVVAAQVEMGDLPESLGAARLASPDADPPPWPPEAVYGSILYHGPAFQGIETIEAWDRSGIRARLQHPDPTRLIDGVHARELALPVALVDTASQLAGLVNGDLDSAGACAIFAFPNAIRRLELSRLAFADSSLSAVSLFEQTAATLCSDTEITLPDGRAVLRYLGKREETVAFPLNLYRYGRNLQQASGEHSLNELFAGVPGIEHVAVCEASAAGHRLWSKAFWAQVLAYVILDPAERQEFQRLKLPPVALADWLLGRMAAKEAVRACLGRQHSLADIHIAKDQHARPLAMIEGQEVAIVSFAHKTFRAVAVAGSPRDLRGAGIDCEPLRPLTEEVRAEAFDTDELHLLQMAARGSDHALDSWQRAAWGAKEAVGKALGRGVLGGPRSIAIAHIDPLGQRFTVQLRGTMLEQFVEYQPESDQRLDASWRQYDDQIVALCLITKP